MSMRFNVAVVGIAVARHRGRPQKELVNIERCSNKLTQKVPLWLNMA